MHAVNKPCVCARVAKPAARRSQPLARPQGQPAHVSSQHLPHSDPTGNTVKTKPLRSYSTVVQRCTDATSCTGMSHLRRSFSPFSTNTPQPRCIDGELSVLQPTAFKKKKKRRKQAAEQHHNITTPQHPIRSQSLRCHPVRLTLLTRVMLLKCEHESRGLALIGSCITN